MNDLNSLSRQALYDLVWSEPVQIAAAKWGVSDVALRKRCVARGVPTPPRGYWAKLEAGRKVQKTPLPETWTKLTKRTILPQAPEQVITFEPPSSVYALDALDGAVAATWAALRRTKPEPNGVISVAGSGILATSITKKHLRRALWLWSQLLEMLKESELSLSIDSGSRISNGKVSVWIELCERLRPFERPYNPRIDKRLYYGKPPEKVKVFIPTGFLAFQAEHVSGAGCPRMWWDTVANPLDSKTERVIDGLTTLLSRKRQIEHEAAERRRAWEDEWRRRELFAEHQRLLKRRREILMDYAKGFEGAERIRRFSDHLWSLALQDESLADFVDWARREADLLDPTESILQRIRDGEDPMILR